MIENFSLKTLLQKLQMSLFHLIRQENKIEERIKILDNILEKYPILINVKFDHVFIYKLNELSYNEDTDFGFNIHYKSACINYNMNINTNNSWYKKGETLLTTVSRLRNYKWIKYFLKQRDTLLCLKTE